MPIKTRTELVNEPSGNTFVYATPIPPYGTVNWVPVGTTALPGASYALRDESIETYNGKDGRFRPCKHTQTFRYTTKFNLVYGTDLTKLEGLPPPPSPRGRVMFSPFGGNFTVTHKLSSVLPGLQATHNPLSLAQWEAQDITALKAILPSMDTGFSLVNFLLELKDFKHIFGIGSVKGFFAKLVNLKRLLNKSLSALSGGGKQTLKELASLHLLKEFGIDPLISDLEKVIEGILSFDRRLNELIARANTQQTRKFRAPIGTGYSTENVITENDATFIQWFWLGGAQTQIMTRTQKRWLVPPEYTCTVRYRYTLPELSHASARMNAFMDTLGVKLDPSIIWNAIPFSFLVDWLVDVGGFLKRFELENSGIRIIIDDFCSSVKSSVLVEILAKHRQIVGSLMEGPYAVVAQGHSRFYHRRNSVPNVLAALKANGLDERKVLLGTSLVVANIRS